MLLRDAEAAQTFLIAGKQLMTLAISACHQFTIGCSLL